MPTISEIIELHKLASDFQLDAFYNSSPLLRKLTERSNVHGKEWHGYGSDMGPLGKAPTAIRTPEVLETGTPGGSRPD